MEIKHSEARALSTQQPTQAGQRGRTSSIASSDPGLANLLFTSLKTIYGAARYAACYPTEKDEQAAKRMWSRDIGKYSHAEIVAKIQELKRLMRTEGKYPHPDIGATLSIATTVRPESERKPAPKKAKGDTAKAYSIINKVNAPDVMGKSDASDEEEKWAAQYVLWHWPQHNDDPMPDDLCELCERLAA